MPKIEPFERCLIFLAETLETSLCICHTYDFDVIGGDVLSSEIRNPIAHCDRGVVLGTQDNGAWEKMVNWRDELLLWNEEK